MRPPPRLGPPRSSLGLHMHSTAIDRPRELTVFIPTRASHAGQRHARRGRRVQATASDTRTAGGGQDGRRARRARGTVGPRAGDQAHLVHPPRTCSTDQHRCASPPRRVDGRGNGGSVVGLGGRAGIDHWAPRDGHRRVRARAGLGHETYVHTSCIIFGSPCRGSTYSESTSTALECARAHLSRGPRGRGSESLSRRVAAPEPDRVDGRGSICVCGRYAGQGSARERLWPRARAGRMYLCLADNLARHAPREDRAASRA